jgi:hypothetical protein
MKITLIASAVLLVILVASLFRHQAKKPPQQSFKTTDEFIQWLAQEAVKDADSNQHITLDYRPESVKKVETILGNLHDMYIKQPSLISERGLSAAYGAYIGEVIRRNEAGVHWERDHAVFGEKSYPLFWGKGVSNPMAWCHKQIVNGEEDSVWVKYSLLKANNGDLGSLIKK